MSVLPRVQPARHQAGRRVLRELAPAPPLRRGGFVHRIGLAFAASLDDKQPLFDARVLWLVPLGLLVADEPVLERPVFWVGCAVHVELIGPDKRVAGSWWRGDRRRRSLGSHKHRNRPKARGPDQPTTVSTAMHGNLTRRR